MMIMLRPISSKLSCLDMLDGAGLSLSQSLTKRAHQQSAMLFYFQDLMRFLPLNGFPIANASQLRMSESEQSFQQKPMIHVWFQHLQFCQTMKSWIFTNYSNSALVVYVCSLLKDAIKQRSVGLKATEVPMRLSLNMHQRIAAPVVSICLSQARSVRRSAYALMQFHLKMRVWSP